jgi:phosphoglycolate phosphatase-like HAD superfamily hydrolase
MPDQAPHRNLCRGGAVKKQISVVITDLDNTLYDWVKMWYCAFSAMLNFLTEESGISQKVLESEIRTIFQKYGTSEYAFLIEEIPSLQKKHHGENILELYMPAVEAYNKARQSALRLYPSVRKTLRTLKKTGCLIIAYTESREYYTRYRVKNLRLDGLLDYLYSPPDHALPEGLSKEKMREKSHESYELKQTVHIHTQEGEYKPNPAILLDIIEDAGAAIDQVIYVGDSLMKDIWMAQQAGVTDVHAKYGEARHKEAYALLKRVSHWPQADVEREQAIYAHGTIHPTYVLENNFGELKEVFDFAPFRKSMRRQESLKHGETSN